MAIKLKHVKQLVAFMFIRFDLIKCQVTLFHFKTIAANFELLIIFIYKAFFFTKFNYKVHYSKYQFALLFVVAFSSTNIDKRLHTQ